MVGILTTPHSADVSARSSVHISTTSILPVNCFMISFTTGTERRHGFKVATITDEFIESTKTAYKKLGLASCTICETNLPRTFIGAETKAKQQSTIQVRVTAFSGTLEGGRSLKKKIQTRPRDRMSFNPYHAAEKKARTGRCDSAANTISSNSSTDSIILPPDFAT